MGGVLPKGSPKRRAGAKRLRDFRCPLNGLSARMPITLAQLGDENPSPRSFQGRRKGWVTVRRRLLARCLLGMKDADRQCRNVAQPAHRVKDKRLRRAFGILDTARRLGFVMVKGLLPTPVKQGLTLRSLSRRRSVGGQRNFAATIALLLSERGRCSYRTMSTTA